MFELEVSESLGTQECNINAIKRMFMYSVDMKMTFVDMRWGLSAYQGLSDLVRRDHKMTSKWPKLTFSNRTKAVLIQQKWYFGQFFMWSNDT